MVNRNGSLVVIQICIVRALCDTGDTGECEQNERMSRNKHICFKSPILTTH